MCASTLFSVTLGWLHWAQSHMSSSDSLNILSTIERHARENDRSTSPQRPSCYFFRHRFSHFFCRQAFVRRGRPKSSLRHAPPRAAPAVCSHHTLRRRWKVESAPAARRTLVCVGFDETKSADKHLRSRKNTRRACAAGCCGCWLGLFRYMETNIEIFLRAILRELIYSSLFTIR